MIDDADLYRRLHMAIAQLNRSILGKEKQVRLSMTALLAKGHLLIEDIPGVGKTTLAHALASTLGLEYNRVQFTSDLLPADILGSSIYERQQENFRFHPGPIFTQVVLADEINRASPKCQSALLEAMEERQVSIEGTTYPLPTPFFVIATQNPSTQIGTYPLPESQLDRFLMTISLGYPDRVAERDLLLGKGSELRSGHSLPQMSSSDIETLQLEVNRVEVSDALIEYLQEILVHSRTSGLYQLGLSPRAGLSLMQASRAWAFIDGRHYVRPDDLQMILPAVVGHRLQLVEMQSGGYGSNVAPLLEIPIP